VFEKQGRSGAVIGGPDGVETVEDVMFMHIDATTNLMDGYGLHLCNMCCFLCNAMEKMPGSGCKDLFRIKLLYKSWKVKRAHATSTGPHPL
jgi:hypothetical protein